MKAWAEHLLVQASISLNAAPARNSDIVITVCFIYFGNVITLSRGQTVFRVILFILLTLIWKRHFVCSENYEWSKIKGLKLKIWQPHDFAGQVTLLSGDFFKHGSIYSSPDTVRENYFDIHIIAGRYLAEFESAFCLIERWFHVYGFCFFVFFGIMAFELN